ncbi:MAG: molybdate ABC transporter permease subunit [Acidobacteria bacterium]|nr:molybdate ABC transporter permease subunit [Acidobacteriota bacterium]
MKNIDWFPLALSFKVALLATALVLIFGVALAWLLARRRFVGRELLDSVITLPLVLPPTVLGYYLLVLLSVNSPVGKALKAVTGWQIVFTWQGAVLAAAIGALPLVVKSSRAAIATVSEQLEDAARTFGKSEWQIFWRITLPLSSRGIIAAAMLAFARSLGDFGATLMVAGNIPHKTQTAAIAIYDAAQAGRDDDALTLVIILSVIVLALLYATNKIAGRSAI